jgi:hypothetical protein
MFKFMTAALVAAFVFLSPVGAEAYGIADSFTYNNAPTHTWQKRGHEQRRYHKPEALRRVVHTQVKYKDGRPRAWCGWWARQQKGVTNPSYNRAINWLNYGRPTSPQVGAVVVWSHHVGIITGRDSRGWLVTSGNWNNRVATVPLSQMGRGVQGYRI